MKNSDKNTFSAHCYTLIGEKEYTHWSEGLKLIIIKNGVKIKLEGEEIELLVKSLPPTMGGTY